MSSSGGEVGFLPRLLVISYAAAIVAIGVYPLENQHGGTVNYFTTRSKELLDREWIPNSWKKGNKIEIDSEQVTPKIENASKPVVFTIPKPDPEKKAESATERREALKNIFESIAE